MRCSSAFRTVVPCSIFAVSSLARAEGPEFSAKGYVKELAGVVLPTEESSAAYDNVVHARVNTRVDWSQAFYTVVEGRALWLAGDSIAATPSFAQAVGDDQGIGNLTHVFLDRPTQVVYGSIDRAYAHLSYGQTETRVGRQRINWGTNLIWNPNDLFNPYSFFDFDYEERPGADAVRVQYFPSETSELEVAATPGGRDRAVVGGLAKLNLWKTDFLSIAAFSRGRGVAGASWSTQVAGAALRGEVSYFTRKTDHTGEAFFVAALSSDYAFENSLYLHVEALYNGNGTIDDAGLAPLPSRLTAEQLTAARYDIFGEVAYNLTPLLRADIAAIVNPADGSFFVSPSLDWSVLENWDLLALAQISHGRFGSEFGAFPSAVFARVKASF